MKRMVWLVLATSLAVAAAACSDSGGDDEAPPATDAPPVTDEAPPADAGDGGLAITEVVFGDDGHVTITNTGGSDASLDGMWLCNRPQYLALSGSLAAGESTEIPASDIPPLGADGGDLGLYTAAEFGSPDAIVDYVAWGGGGGRLTTAVSAGIWPDGDAVAGGGASISAPGGGASAADWVTGSG